MAQCEAGGRPGRAGWRVGLARAAVLACALAAAACVPVDDGYGGYGGYSGYGYSGGYVGGPVYSPGYGGHYRNNDRYRSGGWGNRDHDRRGNGNRPGNWGNQGHVRPAPAPHLGRPGGGGGPRIERLPRGTPPFVTDDQREHGGGK